jgi:hypothetical protein
VRKPLKTLAALGHVEATDDGAYAPDVSRHDEGRCVPRGERVLVVFHKTRMASPGAGAVLHSRTSGLNSMGDDIQRDADDHETVFRTVSGLDGKSMIHEHEIQKVTPTKVYVHQKPRSGNVMGFYKTRQGGTYVLDRRKLEESGRYRTEYGATQTAFYLERSDVEEEVETPGPEGGRSGGGRRRAPPVGAGTAPGARRGAGGHGRGLL